MSNDIAQQPVLVIMGVSGCGKSTVAGILAGRLGWDLEEGDDLHPARNITKMAAGDPLTDDARRPWLDRVAGWIRAHTTAGIPGIITCSALKRGYRDQLRGDHVVFVHPTGSRDTIGQRLAARTDHFMPTALLNSQIASLEPPGNDENVLTVDVGRRSGDEAEEIIIRLQLVRQTRSPVRDNTPGRRWALVGRCRSAPPPDRAARPCDLVALVLDQVTGVVARPGRASAAIFEPRRSNFEPTHSACVVRMFEGLDRRGASEAGWRDVVTARLSTACQLAGADPSLRGPRPVGRRRGDGGGSGRQAVQVDGIPPPPVGRADPIPDATGELDDPRLAGHPAQAEQLADRRGSPVRSHYHQAKCTTGKDDLPRRLHRGSRVSAVRTGPPVLSG